MSFAYHPNPAINRWEHQQQEKARLRRIADIRPVVQSGRPPRPLHPASQPSSRMPSVDGGSRPSSQCSSPVLYKPRRRARSESPARRLAPIQHPAAPGAHALHTDRRSLPEAGSRIMYDPVGNATHYSAPALSVGDSSEALSDLARQDRRSLPPAPSLDSLIGGPKASPRLPPVAPRRQSTGSPSRAVPERREGRGPKKSARDRSNSKKRAKELHREAAKPAAAPRARSGSGQPDAHRAPVSAQPEGLRREPTAEFLQAALRPEPEAEVERNTRAIVEDVGAELPEKSVAGKDPGATDLKSAAEIEDWLAMAKQRLAEVCPPAPQADNHGAGSTLANSNTETQDHPKEVGNSTESALLGDAPGLAQEAGQTAAASEHCSVTSEMPEEVIISSTSGHMPSRSAEAPSVTEESMRPGSHSAAASFHSGQAPSKSAGVPSIMEDSMPPEAQSATISAHEPIQSDTRSQGSKEMGETADDASKGAATGTLRATGRHADLSKQATGSQNFGETSESRDPSKQDVPVEEAQSEHAGVTPSSSLRSGQANPNATGNSDAALASTFRSSRKDFNATSASYADDFEEYEADEDEDDEEDDD
mmetsp:Transcript_78238/g.135716  ORF Transcript_78238/g.135716 Transcript_78238/m.135716 type:complete len:592 (+) Transcript_78238:105-1880(+)